MVRVYYLIALNFQFYLHFLISKVVMVLSIAGTNKLNSGLEFGLWLSSVISLLHIEVFKHHGWETSQQSFSWILHLGVSILS